MQDMKLADISETKKEYMKAKTDKLQTNTKNKNTIEFSSGTNDFKNGLQA
jgi:orotidine-5'-phosphate decarboxylase